jgi:hypothetical protein
MHRVEKYASSGFAAATAKRLKRSMFHALIADDDLAMHKHLCSVRRRSFASTVEAFRRA